VQRIYSEYEYPFRNWQDDLLKARRKFERERDQHQAEARPFLLQEVSRESESLLGWAEHAIGDAEGENQARRGRAMVRRSGESIEVFALFSHSDTISVAPWWGMRDGALPLNGMPDRALVRGVLRSVVNIPEFDCARYGRTGNRECQGSGIDLLISDIEHLTMKDGRLLGLQQAKELRGELMVVFDSEGRCRLPHATLHYSERDGLRVEHDG
ncbi:MAG: hypothetical protein J0H64_00285, partial [Actinobacteria bacterium]|nr:hypothetical protein [Actinomycetota bacterium]